MTDGIPEGWSASELGEISNIRFSNVDKKSHPKTEIPVKLCNYMDVYSNNNITNSLDFMSATANQREIEKFTIERGDVIITKDSETPDDIAVSAFVSEDLKMLFVDTISPLLHLILIALMVSFCIICLDWIKYNTISIYLPMA